MHAHPSIIFCNRCESTIVSIKNFSQGIQRYNSVVDSSTMCEALGCVYPAHTQKKRQKKESFHSEKCRPFRVLLTMNCHRLFAEAPQKFSCDNLNKSKCVLAFFEQMKWSFCGLLAWLLFSTCWLCFICSSPYCVIPHQILYIIGHFKSLKSMVYKKNVK